MIKRVTSSSEPLQKAIDTAAASATSTSARSQKAATSAPKAPAAPATAATGRDWSALSRSFWLAVLPPLCGLGLLVGLWAVVSTTTGGSIPSPKDTWLQALEVFSNPFYRNGPNDQGVGWNVLMSLQRVAIGFGMAGIQYIRTIIKNFVEKEPWLSPEQQSEYEE